MLSPTERTTMAPLRRCITAALAVALFASPASADIAKLPVIQNEAGQSVGAVGALLVAPDGSALTTLTTQPIGTALTDQSVASLSSGQAAGTSTVIAANTSRHVLVIVPPADCTLTLTSGSTRGIPLIGGLPNTFSGAEVPTNALYVSGLTAGQTLVILEG